MPSWEGAWEREPTSPWGALGPATPSTEQEHLNASPQQGPRPASTPPLTCCGSSFCPGGSPVHSTCLQLTGLAHTGWGRAPPHCQRPSWGSGQ